MADVGRRVAQCALRDASDPVIIGRVADSLALVHHLPSYNFSDFEYRREDILRRYRPTHFEALSNAEMQECLSLFPERFRGAEMVFSAPLLRNYYTGEPLRLYRLRPGA